ncbi:NAD(P)-dependent oxidoreductase [Parasedimentitalea psychrophila]|uniref:Hydroxyacid dehydrogenase n=1 Tax=Parasedimentitalea psychrophila TaxID=2997337 RepID=A0A9Y2L0C8_9RHOB|nr:hydroxyacid dehydrogenase [Parasedimentitalea psychrophila]WIY25734.1 hydroxyacid dehydrogenase [Parasedimentitalea psychrophila]
MVFSPLIFSTHNLHPDVASDLQEIGELRIASAPTPSAIYGESAGAEIIIVRAPIDPEILRRETGLRALVRHGAGLDMIPVDSATQAGVLVANVPGANSVTVAEHVIFSSLALLRQYPRVNSDLRQNGWEAGRQHSNSGREMSGRTLGILGMGNVGQALHRMAQLGFGMKVISHTRTPAKLPTNIRAVSFDDLLRNSDILALCCPLNDQTRGVIDRQAIDRMKTGAILVNVSRGPVIDEDAVIGALQAGKLAGAALDVFSGQPLPPDHPIFSQPNVILTPHMAGITEESMYRMGAGVVAEVRRIVDGILPKNLINPSAVSNYRSRFNLD